MPAFAGAGTRFVVTSASTDNTGAIAGLDLVQLGILRLRAVAIGIVFGQLES